MKQIVLTFAAMLLTFGACAQNTVKLPAPAKDAGMTLYQALQRPQQFRDKRTCEYSKKARS